MVSVTLSLGSFYTWLNTPEGAKKLSSLILSSGSKVDGYEVTLLWDELETFTEAIEEGFAGLPVSCQALSPAAQAHIRSLPKLSFHLSDAKDLNFDQYKWASLFLGRLHLALKHSTFVIHPDETHPSMFNRLVSEIVEPGIITVENMCPRKKSHTSLSEISDLLRTEPSLGLTFDICHWLEVGGEHDGADLRCFLSEFGPRIKAFHISLPSSQYEGYKELDLTHCLCSRSGISIDLLMTNLLNSVRSDFSLIIEGYVPEESDFLVTEEIAHLNRWAQNIIEVRRKRFAA